MSRKSQTVQDVDMADVGPARPLTSPSPPVNRFGSKIAGLLKRLESPGGKGSDKKPPAEYLRTLQTLTLQDGMADEDLFAALKVATSGVLTIPQAMLLLTMIRPRRLAAVTKDLVIRSIGRLGPSWSAKSRESKSKRVDAKVQAACLKQLILLLPYMDGGARAAVDCLYGVIFGFLDSESLRGYAAHLLYLITKRQHVKHFRITKLLALRKSLGGLADFNQIAGLLRLYRNYYPDLVVADLGINIRQSLFTSPDPEWTMKTKEIVAKYSALSEDAVEDVGRGGLGGERAAKRVKIDHAAFIPSTATFLATEESHTLNEHQSTFQLGKRLDKVDLPSRAASVLEGISSMAPRSRLGGWAMTVAGNETYFFRFESWLIATLDDLFNSCDYTPATTLRAEDLLNRALNFYRMQGELSPAMEGFLANFWCTWDGDLYRKQVFALLGLWRPTHSEELHSWALDPLAQISRSSDAEWKAAFVRTLQTLIMSWTRRRRQATHEDARDLSLSDAELCESIKHLVAFADRYSTSAVLAHPASVTLRAAVLSLHDVLPSLPLEHNVAALEVPSYAVVYSSLFSDISGLSLICGVLARYKQVLESNEPRAAQGAQNRTPFKEPFTSAFLTSFNAYLMNACNLFWRGKALTKEDKNADSCGIEPSWVKALAGKAARNGRDIKVIFGITQSAAFLNLAMAYLRGLEREANIPADRWHKGPITSQHLKELVARQGLSITYSEFRIGFVDFLEELGAVGLSSFLHVSLSSLMSRPRKSVVALSTPSSTSRGANVRQPPVPPTTSASQT